MPTTSPRPGPSADRYLLFMRHGAAAVPADTYPRHDVMGLSPEGREQVVAARQAVAALEPELIISSPMPRALETAHLVDDLCGIGVQVDDRLRERTIPALYGRRYRDIEAEIGPAGLVQLLDDSSDFRYDGAESPEQAQSRVRDFVGAVFRRVERRVLVVSHGGPHGWTAAHLLGLTDPRDGRHFRLGHARLSCFRLADRRARHAITALNVSGVDLLDIIGSRCGG